MKPWPLLVLGLLIIPIGFPFASAMSYVRTLPSNTIYFDDFSNGFNGWSKVATGTTTNTLAQLNTTRSFDGNASIGLYEPNSNSHIEVDKSIATSATVIGIQVWTAFNYLMYSTNDGQAPELQASWDTGQPGTPTVHHALVEYRPAKGQFVAFSPDDGSPLTFYTFSGAAAAKNGYTAYNDALLPQPSKWANTWYWLKVIFNRSTNQYVSYCASVGCFANVTGLSIANAPSGVVAPDQSQIEITLRLTNDATALNANALFSDLLVTDEGSSPSIIQLALFNSAYYLAIFVGGMVTVLVGMNALKTPAERNPHMKKILVFATVMGLAVTVLFVFGLLLKG